ncbi:hypothetical protein [Methylopila sp. 73B]|uniref:hypothetical protein n=1 Tax=Methylopila sp. 73B TaxID=1120792 RepID=UPI00036F4C26|nr:hypothetical protein [Methylopila sp. 73B]
MTLGLRLAAAFLVACAVGAGAMIYDQTRGADWAVSPQQIAAAKAAGQAGVETRPGSVAVLPIRSETADVLPFKWALLGLAAGALTFVGLRRRTRA